MITSLLTRATISSIPPFRMPVACRRELARGSQKSTANRYYRRSFHSPLDSIPTFVVAAIRFLSSSVILSGCLFHSTHSIPLGSSLMSLRERMSSPDFPASPACLRASESPPARHVCRSTLPAIFPPALSAARIRAGSPLRAAAARTGRRNSCRSTSSRDSSDATPAMRLYTRSRETFIFDVFRRDSDVQSQIQRRAHALVEPLLPCARPQRAPASGNTCRSRPPRCARAARCPACFPRRATPGRARQCGIPRRDR